MNRRTHSSRIPTVNDLRVKLCYICREEEQYDAPAEDPPRAWTHPCTCTLVAHESCLLRWIQTSQADTARAANALKCPQCGTKYELVSHRPTILKLFGAGNSALQRAGRLVTLCGAAGIIAVFASGVYIALTAYGAWAVKQFIGEEMFELLLTDNPANWSWTTFFNLPTVPLSLVLSRFQTPALIPSLIPILLIWPPAPPLNLNLHVGAPTSASTDIRLPQPNAIELHPHHAARPNPFWTWPPTPTVFGFVVVPLVRAVYRRLWARVQVWVLGSQPPSARRTLGVTWDGWPLVIRIRADIRREGQVQQGGNEQEGGAVLAQAQAQDDEVPEEQRALAAAEQHISISTSSLGRRVGGALMIPYISARMGSLLLSLSKNSALLRRALAVRPPLVETGHRTWIPGEWEGLSAVRHVQKALGMVWRSSWRGSGTWARADPVWWRNAIGLGVFVVAKDCIELMYLWLTTRELSSRHVKNRDFSGVDIRELDLIPGFPRGSQFEGEQQLPVRARSLPRGL